MISLTKKAFALMMIFFMLLSIPLLTIVFGLYIYTLKTAVLWGLFVPFIIWFIGLIITLPYCFSKKWYLLEEEFGLIIKYPDIYCHYTDILQYNKGTDDKKNFAINTDILQISYDSIIQIEYIKLSRESIVGLMLLEKWRFPRSVKILCKYSATMDKELYIGYMDLKTITSIANRHNIDLVIH